jgi:uncharacterized membrane protein
VTDRPDGTDGGPLVFRGAAFDRILFFSDAVIAIAITLVVLPLVDSARDLGDRTAGEFLSDSGGELAAAALSFVVIGVFWRTHHRVFAAAEGATPRAVSVNFVWLACLAFLPVPTVLVVAADGDDPVAHVLYIGTLLVAVVALVLEELVLERQGLLPRSDDPPVARWVTAVAVALALVVSVVVPSWSMWPVLVMVPAGWVQRRLAARARRTAPPA